MMMKYIYSILFVLFFTGCGDDNSYDGETGLIGTVSAQSANLDQLYTDVYQYDANLSLVKLSALLTDLQTLQIQQDAQTLNSAQESFKEFIRTQKRVEASFIVDEFSDEFLDTLGYMEYFHVADDGDLISELDRIFANDTALENALYKNANQSITSLEYTLFGADENTTQLLEKFDARRAQAAYLMASQVQTYTQQIVAFYNSDTSFTQDLDVTTAALINQLIDSAYKLKEWRIGEAAGFVLKYAGSVDHRRLEYYKSAFSLDAIEEILLTHQRIMQNGLSEIASGANAAAEAQAVEESIVAALTLCNSYASGLEESLELQKTQDLYNAVNLIQQNYTALISSLNFTQKIIEADGD